MSGSAGAEARISRPPSATRPERSPPWFGRMWSRSARSWTVGAVVTVKGQVQRYNNRLQLVIRRAATVPPEGVDETLFVRSSSVDVDTLWQRLTTLIEGVDNEHLRQLLFRVISDPEVTDRFRVAPAARGHAPRLSHRVARAHRVHGDHGASARRALLGQCRPRGGRVHAARSGQDLGARHLFVHRIHRRGPVARSPDHGGALRRSGHLRDGAHSPTRFAASCSTSFSPTMGGTNTDPRGGQRRPRRCWFTWPTTSTPRWPG